MVNRKILRMRLAARNNVEFKIETDCEPLLTVVGVAEVRPTPIPELVTEGTAERFLVNDDYALFVICKAQTPGTEIKATVTGKSGGSTSTTVEVDEIGEGLLRLGFRITDGVVEP